MNPSSRRASSVAIAALTLAIAKVNLTVAGITASGRIYDGTTAASLNVASAALVGVVDGDASGVALVMAKAGAEVGVTALSEANATRVAEQIRAGGGKGWGWSADATRLADMQALGEKVTSAMGGVDVLINGVGDAIPRDLLREEVRRAIRQRLTATAGTEWVCDLETDVQEAMFRAALEESK